MSLLEAISPSAKNLLRREKTISDIIARDDEPPEAMKPTRYRVWLETLSASDLAEYHRIVKKCHPKKKAA